MAHVSFRPSILVLSIFCCAHAYAASFSGTGMGLIPNPSTCDDSLGTPLIISFSVSGMTVPVNNLGVSITFEPTHTSVGDLQVKLASPSGLRSMLIFSRTGHTDTGPSYTSNVTGPYLFSDNQTGDWWKAAGAIFTDEVVPAGGYRTTGDGAPTQTSLAATFDGLAPAQSNGTWTLTFTDDCSADAGGVGEATLFLNDLSTPVRLQMFSVE